MSAAVPSAIASALVNELSVVIASLIDSPVRIEPASRAAGPQWTLEVHATGALAGALTVAFDRAGAESVTRRITGVQDAVADQAIADTLRELGAQAVAALADTPLALGTRLTAGTVGTQPPAPTADAFTFVLNGDALQVPLVVTVAGSVVAVAEAAALSAPPVPASVNPAGPGGDRLDVILDIDLPLVVRFGRTELPLRTVSRLGPGSVIDLGRSPDDPVEILVSNRVVARGEVVIVSGNYGIRILDVVSPRERVRSLEA